MILRNVGLFAAMWCLTGCYVYGEAQGPAINATVNTPTVVAGGQCTCVQGAAEVCNGCDDNCNGAVDEGCGGGVVTDTNVSVSGPSYQPPPTSGTVVVTGTTVAQPAPVQCVCQQGAREACGDGCDNNCNGSIDEGC